MVPAGGGGLGTLLELSLCISAVLLLSYEGLILFIYIILYINIILSERSVPFLLPGEGLLLGTLLST